MNIGKFGKKPEGHFLSWVKVVLFIKFKSEIQIFNGLYQVLWQDHLVLDMMKIFQGELSTKDLSLLWLQWAQVLFKVIFSETDYFLSSYQALYFEHKFKIEGNQSNFQVFILHMLKNIKFRYSEKATQIWTIFHFILNIT